MKLLKFENIVELTDKIKTEKQAINYFVKLRWGNKVEVKCPFCGCDAYNLKNQNTCFKCKKCYKKFSYKTGTIFENTKISMKKWFIAMYLHGSHKKGISSHQLARDLSVTQKTAWFMLNRIREIMKNNTDKFDGITEIDEAYIGGSEANKHSNKKGKNDKFCVVGMINRNTRQAKAYHISSNEKENLLPKVYLNVKDKSTIITDSYSAYDELNKTYDHEFVKHSAGEYVKTNSKKAYKIHTNDIEGFWSHMKRGIYGIYHFCSEKHSQRYINEFTYRWNTKGYTEASRFNALLLNSVNKRLKYVCLIG